MGKDKSGRATRLAEMRVLDSKWLSRGGNVTFALAALRFAYGWIANDPATALTLVLLGAGVVLMGIPYVTRAIEKRRPTATPPTKETPRVRPPQSPPSPNGLPPISQHENLARQALAQELVALIDEWKLVRGDAFKGTDFGTYSLWAERTSNFIGTALGETERSRFQSNGDETNLSLERQAELRIRALERLRDNPDEWMLDGKTRDDIHGATKIRRTLGPQDKIILAGAPALAKQYEIEVDATPEDETALTETQTGEVDAPPPPSHGSSDFGLRGSLEKAREDGYRLLNALKGGPIMIWKYDRIPKPEDIDAWEAEVEHTLHREPHLLTLFKYRPLGQEVLGSTLAAIADAIGGGPEVRRLENRLAQLDKVIERA